MRHTTPKPAGTFQLLVLTWIFSWCGAVSVTAQDGAPSEPVESVCKIKGRVLSDKFKSIALLRPHEDARHDKYIRIPIVKGRFEYELKLKHPEYFDLMFGEAIDKGFAQIMPLFVEPGVIEILVHDHGEFNKNTVKGGKLNDAYREFLKLERTIFNTRFKPLWNEERKLREAKQFYSRKMMSLLESRRKARNQDEKLAINKEIGALERNRQTLTPEARTIVDTIQSIDRERVAWQMARMKKNPSVISLFLFYNFLLNFDSKFQTLDLQKIGEIQKTLASRHPDHPYTKRIADTIRRLNSGRVGDKFIDFVAPDLSGKPFRLSNQIKGKVALIDLWASWCGPCIAKSRTIAPVYNEFKDKGFTIVGIAAEFDDTDQLKAALKREKYPWLNLVELDGKNGIWAKYGLANQGGAKFLVDRHGTIIAVDPTAEELRKILTKQLQPSKTETQPILLDRATLSGLNLAAVKDPKQPDRKLFQKRLYRGPDISVFVVSSESATATHQSYPFDEFLFLINGSARMKETDGREYRMDTGNFFVAPKGFAGEWETIGGGQFHHELSVITTQRNHDKAASANGKPCQINARQLSGTGAGSANKPQLLFSGAELKVQTTAEKPLTARFDGKQPEQLIRIIVGSLVLTPIRGKPQTFFAGDFVVIPSGFQGTWKSKAHDQFRCLRVMKARERHMVPRRN